jgi:cytochrome b561
MDDGDDAQVHLGHGKTEKMIPAQQQDVPAPTTGAEHRLHRQPVSDVAITRPRKLVVLHWLTVLCLVLVAVFILTRDEVDGRAARMWLLEGHRHFGLFVLLLFFVRVAFRLRAGKLPHEEGPGRLMRWLAISTHMALYALLLVQPLLGWSLSNAEGKPVHFFGVTLPALVRPDEDLADSLHAWHQDTAWLLLALISLHVAGALYHHFILRDGVLRLMLPKRRH